MGFIDVDKAVRSAIVLLKPEPFSVFDREGYEYSRAYNQGVKDAILHFMRQPAADVAPRWIPVTDGLPEEDYETGNGVQFSADVLATIVNHANDGELYCWLLKTVDGKWYDYVPNADGEHEIPFWCEVIAWMPLPEPYKEGE